LQALADEDRIGPPGEELARFERVEKERSHDGKPPSSKFGRWDGGLVYRAPG
jgi:hypothetical protein